jgi:hypothetical protein
MFNLLIGLFLIFHRFLLGFGVIGSLSIGDLYFKFSNEIKQVCKENKYEMLAERKR